VTGQLERVVARATLETLEETLHFSGRRGHVRGGNVTGERQARAAAHHAVPLAPCPEDQLSSLQLVLEAVVEEGAVEEVVSAARIEFAHEPPISVTACRGPVAARD
jgi:hypothetical protein